MVWLTGIHAFLPMLLRANQVRDASRDSRRPFSAVGLDPFAELFVAFAGTDFAGCGDDELFEDSHGGREERQPNRLVDLRSWLGELEGLKGLNWRGSGGGGIFVSKGTD